MMPHNHTSAVDTAPVPPLPGHAVPRDQFRAIARGRGGAGAVRLLRSGQLSKRCLLLVALHRQVVGSGPDVAVTGADWFGAAYEEISRWQRSDPPRWEAMLLRPQFDTWAAQCLKDLHSGHQARLTGLVSFADLPASLLPEGERLPSRTTGSSQSATAHELVLEWRGHSWSLTLQDAGPDLNVFGHTPTGPLTPAELTAWTEALVGAWEILVRRHPWHAEAVSASISTLVPLHPAANGSPVSAAARRAYGAVAASLPVRPGQLALTLVHEFLHVQLGALMDLVPLHKPDTGARFHAPWRPDPRPAGALLQGLYAHMGVADFHHQEHLFARDDAVSARESVRWRAHAAGAADALLASNELTPLGREFTGEVLSALRGMTFGRVSRAEVPQP